MDLKSLSSHNNIIKHAQKAISKQGAKVVLFEFTLKSESIDAVIAEMKRKKVKAYYYFSGDNIIYKTFSN